jgi:hypothetical protein
MTISLPEGQWRSGADEAGVKGAGERDDCCNSNDHTQEREPVKMSDYEVAFGQENVHAHASEQNWQSAIGSKSCQSNSNREICEDSGPSRMH